MDKYPTYTLEILKTETTYQDVSEILNFLKTKIDEHKVAAFISIFNHYEHTTKLSGQINPSIKDAQNIIFCFGSAIPTTKILAARPRSIGVCELENSFIIEFLEPPKEDLTTVMESWAQEIKNI